MATLSPPLSPPLGVEVSPPGIEAAPRLRDMKAKAIRGFRATEGSHAYSSPLFLRRFLELHLPELPYDGDPGCSSHTMLLLPDQTYEDANQSFLSILCAECRYHFHVKTYKACSRSLDGSNHPSHMLIPSSADPQGHKDGTGDAEFICAVQDCLYTVQISVMPPKLTTWQISMLQDDSRILRNLQLARKEDPQRYLDIPDTWGAGSTIGLLARYIEDRLSKPSGDVLKIKKRNKRFCVSFGKDFDDLLRSLGFEEKTDEEGEECWYITEAKPVLDRSPSLVHSRRAHLQDTLEELRTFLPNSSTTPAWSKLMDAFPGYLSRRETDLVTPSVISEDDLILLGCLREFSPQWFSWAAILLASICPSRRDTFLDAGLRCIQERSEEASLSIIMYKSEFDQMASITPDVRAAFEFLGASPGDDEDRILAWFDAVLNSDIDNTLRPIAFGHLATLADYTGSEKLHVIAWGDASSPSNSSSGSTMSVRAAAQLLKVEVSFSAELIREFIGNVDKSVDRQRVIQALEVLSDHKRQNHLIHEADSLREAAEFLRQTHGALTGQIKSLESEQGLATESAAPFSTPPGLRNIGNTCYLNSLLQYFYNVKPVRDMVLSYHKIQLELDDASVDNRRTGGNGTRVTLEEAIVARQFVEELRRLFTDLQTTKGAAASPSQKLANTALSSAKEILTSKDQNQPPPLPARPSPAPPASPSKQPATVNVTVEPVTDHHDVLSCGSSQQTLVNEIDDMVTDTTVQEQNDILTSISADNSRGLSPEDRALSDTVEHVEDIGTEEPPAPLSLEQKISHISQRLEQSDRSGTSQQDVEEIIGNILEHFMRAIRPDGPMKSKPDLQADSITELFFTTIVNSTIKTMTETEAPVRASSIDEDILNEEVVPERWITAFPHPDKEHKMKNNLYEALDRYFSYELLSDGSLARYTTIRALPPIVHICIQRSDASGVKNKNPVIIPEELYLDRYMETVPGSSLWNTRRRVWAVKERIKELESRKLNSVESMFKSQESQAWNTYADAHTNQEQHPEYQDPINLTSDLWRDIPSQSKRTTEVAELNQLIEPRTSKKRSIYCDDAGTANFNFIDTLQEAGKRMDEMVSTELMELHEEEAGAFDSMKQHRFCLHAMICHGGGMNAGHYWVWVRDFKNQVWYKYNDSVVTKDSRDSQQVIDELNNSGDPYYVAYVQDKLKDSLVDVPQRAQTGNGDDVHMANVAEEELEVIDSIAVNTPPQPANSPVNTPLS